MFNKMNFFSSFWHYSEMILSKETFLLLSIMGNLFFSENPNLACYIHLEAFLMCVTMFHHVLLPPSPG